ncbi:glycosyltransferase family 4 protein [Desulfosarcina ovata]|uniref:Glycosyl transferase n=1 Tax=Desulfosarcina ovata subsp. ovata TaxID=2752305 RepID=A0A5K8A500_9BACT|nr:glycosyltransferase family 4 protein [Desulfosarcina ovata]BBO87370.1 glycosyl transferase [Desulfosarcina ovata subsp. ovata]
MYIPFDTVHHIGFISTRFAGTDGVSLETEKWARVFEKERFKCFYFAGELDRDPSCSFLSPKAHFMEPEIRTIFNTAFGVDTYGVRDRALTTQIHTIKDLLKDQLYDFIAKFNIDLLVPENALTIPLNIPLGLAITELIAETGLPCIAHHHDFFWERQQFKANSVWDYLNMAFPPHLPTIRHVVISSSASNQLSLRTGISSTIIPNVMDFENPPAPPDEYTDDVRQALGLAADEKLILQPTRVVKRKGIENAIELVSRLGIKSRLVISHASGDEGHDYEQRVIDYSRRMGVDTLFVSDIINDQRGTTADGRKIYTLNDIYHHADFITYPSTVEGFGNAFLEAVYFRKPIMVNRYSIYTFDIKPKGFQAVEIDGYVTEDAVAQTQALLQTASMRQKMVENNYRLAKQFYSYSVLHKKLMNLMI